ncbi:MAG: metal-dependent hydrolase [Ruminococcaceae bacterium]|nr:metal-dependent hydrolase [Oscillospiraceae bacterium]
MIIDLHTHIFPDKIAEKTIEKLCAASHTRPFSDATANGLRQSMKTAGVELSVVMPVATNPHQVTHVNDASAQLNEQGEGLISFGCIHPDCEEWKDELDRVARLGFKGIKLHPIYQGMNIDDARYVRILTRAGELGLVVMTHAGKDIGFPGQDNCTPEMLRRAVRAAGPVQLIAAHMGGWHNWDRVCDQLADLPTVGLDTAYVLGLVRSEPEDYYAPEERVMMSEEEFVSMVRSFGAQRIFFGTDSPWRGQKEELAYIEALPLTPEEKRAILGENARKLLGV